MFSPPLPRAKAAAIAALAIGCVDKMFITFEAGAPAGGCSDGRAGSAAARRPAMAPAPAAPRPAVGAGRRAPAPAQRGGAALPGAAVPEPSAYHTSQGRAVVAFQLLWRSNAAQLGPLAEAPPGGPAARARDAPAADAPKTWDSASSHLAASGAAELAGPATAARPAVNGAAHGAANGATNGAANGGPATADQVAASRLSNGVWALASRVCVCAASLDSETRMRYGQRATPSRRSCRLMTVLLMFSATAASCTTCQSS